MAYLEEVRPFAIIRPSGMPFEQEIVSTLESSGFRVIELQEIPNWIALAKQLYMDKFGIQEKNTLQPGALAWLASTEALFGKRGTLVLLEHVKLCWSDSPCSILNDLCSIKKRYRESKKEYRGILDIRCYYNGEEYEVFFDYLHTPDPDMDRLKYEWKLIGKHVAIE